VPLITKVPNDKPIDPRIDELLETHAHRNRGAIHTISTAMQMVLLSEDPAKQEQYLKIAKNAATKWSHQLENRGGEYDMVLRQYEKGFIEFMLVKDAKEHGVELIIKGEANSIIPGFHPMQMRALYGELVGANPSKYFKEGETPKALLTIESEEGFISKITIQCAGRSYPGGQWSKDDGSKYSNNQESGGTGLAYWQESIQRLPYPFSLTFGVDNTEFSLGGNILTIEPQYITSLSEREFTEVNSTTIVYREKVTPALSTLLKIRRYKSKNY
jgi:hypothetical protein